LFQQNHFRTSQAVPTPLIGGNPQSGIAGVALWVQTWKFCYMLMSGFQNRGRDYVSKSLQIVNEAE
jgi:hypothetical protein